MAKASIRCGDLTMHGEDWKVFCAQTGVSATRTSDPPLPSVQVCHGVFLGSDAFVKSAGNPLSVWI